jgi:deoxyribose-phosphate aldolase
MTSSATITVTYVQLAKTIDHALLHPTMTDSEIVSGLALAGRLKVAAACVKPYSVAVARDVLSDSGVLICAVVGFPHGSSTTTIKVAEAEEAVREGAREIDVVVNVGKVLGGDWEYVTNEIRAVNDAVVKHGGDALKVIFENDFLEDKHIVHLCRICSALGVAFVKTSTGFGFVKQPGGLLYACRGATVPHLRLMRANVGPIVHVKAAGGIRTLDELLLAMALGATRIGTSATEAILDEAVARGIGTMPVRITLKPVLDVSNG